MFVSFLHPEADAGRARGGRCLDGRKQAGKHGREPARKRQ